MPITQHGANTSLYFHRHYNCDHRTLRYAHRNPPSISNNVLWMHVMQLFLISNTNLCLHLLSPQLTVSISTSFGRTSNQQQIILLRVASNTDTFWEIVSINFGTFSKSKTYHRMSRASRHYALRTHRSHGGWDKAPKWIQGLSLDLQQSRLDSLPGLRWTAKQSLTRTQDQAQPSEITSLPCKEHSSLDNGLQFSYLNFEAQK